MSRPVTATCLACGTPHCKCPRPTPADVARVAAIGRDTLELVRRAALRGRTVTSAVINGRLVLVETFDD